jgi:hypothetical protein
MTTKEVRDRLAGILPRDLPCSYSAEVKDVCMGGFRHTYEIKSYHVAIEILNPDFKETGADLPWEQRVLFNVHASSQASLDDAYYNAVDMFRNWEASRA